MKHGHRLLVAGLGVVTLAVTLALIAARGQASMAVNGIIYVDAGAGGENNGTSWADAYTDLQLALGAAVPGNDIWVAEGTYKPTSGTDRTISFQMKNGVAIYGGFDPSVDDDEWEERDWEAHLTILSGDIGSEGISSDNSYHVFYHPEEYMDLDSSAILDGFTISGGNADDSADPNSAGGGMYNSWASSPTLNNCTFSGNSATYSGGGMYSYLSSPILTNCTFSGNSADSGSGGGMYNEHSSPELTDCTFEGNSAAGSGGGMLNEDHSGPTLTNCSFEGNSAGYSGGGMYNSHSYESPPVLVNSTFSGNSAGSHGGGMSNVYSSSVLVNCTFEGNWAYYGGGGINNLGSSPVLTNCTFEGNSVDFAGGGGMYNELYSSPILTNCILWGDTPDETYNLDSTPNVTYSDVQGGYEGEGNIDADPLFVDAANGDYHLQLGSPCIDVGDNDAPYLPDSDFEGNARVLDGDGNVTRIVDMGVDEVAVEWSYSHVYLPLVFRGY